ncbi:uncharacterized protein [Palaemon carinicauda]|uniref:uncharacterized protein n=1 Tax=Palaemon carinicauda TaxID=392227 RepID=UPI0035B68D9B
MVNDKETGQKFAAKFVNTKRNQDRANVEREIDIMKALNAERPHPRLIQLYDAFDMDKEMCLVLEIVDGGELFERVIDDDFVLTERACTIFVRQICEGVEFIHSKNILHLDMKPENILCLSREGNRIKICDFGLARKYDPRKKLQVLFGTPEFVAPEVVNFEPISFGTDMWSVGVITYVLLSGLSPFMGHNYVETMTNVTKNKYDFEDEAFKSVSEDAKDFIRKLLVLDKSLRLTPAQCRHHSWLRQPPPVGGRRRLPEHELESETESEEETDQEDMSIEEKILQEEKENEKDKRKREADLLRQVELKRKDLEKQAEIKKKEIEKQAEAKKLELERQEETKRKEEEKKKELERQTEVEKKGEELELTKKQLKEFVERWNSHPNSPYLIGTPIALDLQRIVKTGGWNSRDSFASVVVGPPSDPGDISEPENDLDIIDQEEFIRYTIEPQKTLSKQPSPEEVAKELEERLTILQQQELTDRKEKEEKPSEVKDAEVELQNMANNEKSRTEAVEATVTGINELQVKTETAKGRKKSSEAIIPKKPIDSKRKTVDAEKGSKESKIEKQKKAYEERKRMKNLEEEKKKKEAADKIQTEPKKEDVPEKKQNIDHKSSSLDSLASTDSCLQVDSRKDNLPDTNHLQSSDIKVQDTVSPVKEKEQEQLLGIDSASETLKKINEISLNDYKKEYEEYLRMVSESEKKIEEPQVQGEPKKLSPTPTRNNNKKLNEAKLPVNKSIGLEKSASVSAVKDLEKKEAAKVDRGERRSGVNLINPFRKRFGFGKETPTKSKPNKQATEEDEPLSTKPKEVDLEEHKKLYQEYLIMVGENQTKSDVKSPNMNEVENKTMENHLSESSRELQRKVSDSYKAMDSQRKSSAKTIENLPKEPLKRPEIIALQHEEFGSSVPRQRKTSVPRYEVGDLATDRGSRGSTPGSVPDGSHSPKFDRSDQFDRNSRGSTPTKQLKKQPSRDVPLPPKDEPVRQRRPSRDVPVSYTPGTYDDSYTSRQRPSRDLTPEATPSLSRKPSCEERPPSRGTREGTPVNRRPSRDVPLTPSQLERLSGASALASADQGIESQAWPDLIVVPQGEQVESDEDCSVFKDSLDVPVATLVKSPSGTLLSVPGVTISQHDRDTKAETLQLPVHDKEENDPTYMSNNKLVAWILDIGNIQNQRNVPSSTSERVSKWESRDSSPKPVGRSSRDTSPRPRDRSPLPSDRLRDKSPVANKQQPNLYPLSREPSMLSLKSSASSENLFLQTPWGAMKRSPSRTNLSQSPSFEVPANTLRDSQKATESTTEDLSQYSQSDDHMSVDSSTRSPSPKVMNSLLQKQDSLEISEIKDFQSYSRLSGELPPKPPEKGKVLHRSNREENLNISNISRKDDPKSYTLPRSSKLMKTSSVSSMQMPAGDKKVDNKKSPSANNKATESNSTDTLKRKSKFPPSPNQKKKLGPLLFSAQDRISQFEQTKTTPRTQRPISRTHSSMVFSKTTERIHPASLLENSLDVNKNAKTPLISCKSSDKTHVKYLTNRLLDKVGKPPGGPQGEILQNVDSLNNNIGNNRRNSVILCRRDSTGMIKH